MRGIAAAVLVFEGLVILFATLVALDLSDVEDTTLWWVGGSMAVACVVAAALVRRPWGYWLGSVVQVVVVTSGLVLTVPAMLFLGVVFAGLWFLAVYLGLKVERLQAQRAADEGHTPPG